MLKVKYVEGRAKRVRLLFHKLKDLFMIMPIGMSYRWADASAPTFLLYRCG
ncbi:hypothetical protein UUU_30280 [Klebsiella pneumoniae subsp. pneumoniae DSM 30104 = JCM 1662 = NBRC 14940]|nr:hypothetical protein UUU_30280 [Klebsiella pneumoniae subsp. pneumoniae DSM 30104 = JCM 1662 = NBRC 14940]